MKFIHIADVHLGAHPEAGRPWAKEREQEILKSFNHVMECCNEQQIDVLLIAGDLFHRQPNLRELKEVNYYFQKLWKTHVVFIAGNHDYIGSRSEYPDFKWADHVTMLSTREIDSIYIEKINTEIYGFSYYERDIYEKRLEGIKPTVEGRINILLAHGGDDRNMPINYKQLSNAGFDYVALGHIHKAEIINERMAYSGSLEALDRSELGDHGYIYGRIKKYTRKEELSYQSEIKLEFIKSNIRKYIELKITIDPSMTNAALKELLKEEIEKNGTKHLYRIYLEGLKDVDLNMDQSTIMTLGNIVEFLDKTEPDYDFEALFNENRANIIGMFMERIQNRTTDEIVAKKALYFGLEALLNKRK